MYFFPLLLCLSAYFFPFSDALVNPTIVSPIGYMFQGRSGNSTLYQMNIPNSPWAYQYPPYLLNLQVIPPSFFSLLFILSHLQGTRYQIGYDYAVLMHEQSISSLEGFMAYLFTDREQILVCNREHNFFVLMQNLKDKILVIEKILVFRLLCLLIICGTPF